jgi:hypothetical protein
MLELLENSAMAVWVRESPSIFAYTLVLSLHAIGLAIVVGLSTLIALRLLGTAPTIPLSALNRLYPVLLSGFFINVASGVLLFVAGATNMGTMAAFWIKMTLVSTGMIIGWRIKHHCTDVPEAAAGVATPAARRLAWASLACWLCALVAGRLISYPHLVASLFGA